jgi:hypothetical protein
MGFWGNFPFKLVLKTELVALVTITDVKILGY